MCGQCVDMTLLFDVSLLQTEEAVSKPNNVNVRSLLLYFVFQIYDVALVVVVLLFNFNSSVATASFT